MFVVVCITSISSDTSKVLNVKLCLKIYTSIFAFILSGGNHVTAFMGFLTIATVVMYGFFRKNKMLVFRNLLPFAFSLFGLLLNFLSPGTKIRQSNFQKTGFVKTIVLATFRGFENTNLWINVAIILSILLMIPFFLRAAQRLLENGKCKFDKPLLVLILGAAYPCLEFCPPFYAVGHEGDGRLLNVVYFSIVFILFFEMFYICGWFLSKIKVDLEFVKKSLQPKSKIFSILAVLFLCMTFFCACGRSSYGFQATRMILNGRAAQYDKEANERAKKAEESAGLDIQFKQFSVKPSLLFIEDLSEDSEIWPNIDYARFYNLKSVTLVE